MQIQMFQYSSDFFFLNSFEKSYVTYLKSKNGPVIYLNYVYLVLSNPTKISLPQCRLLPWNALIFVSYDNQIRFSLNFITPFYPFVVIYPTFNVVSYKKSQRRRRRWHNKHFTNKNQKLLTPLLLQQQFELDYTQ